jgi:hypothetical protein
MNNLITWISVEDRLPSYHQPVLVFIKGCSTSYEASFNPNEQQFHHPYYGQCELGYFVDVTHWTPMPEKP